MSSEPDEGDDAAALAAALQSRAIDPAWIPALARYGALVLATNRHTNLTGAADPERFADQIADALTLAADVAAVVRADPAATLVDIGSGGGLPGIPLALATAIPVTLLDSVAKKAAFLGETLGKLNLRGEALPLRAEVVARDPAHRARYAVATARAVSSAPAVAELTIPFLKIGGRALLQRGAWEPAEQNAFNDALPILGATLIEERPLGGNRRLLIVEKRTPTSPRFPRRNGIPMKRPLCLTPDETPPRPRR